MRGSGWIPSLCAVVLIAASAIYPICSIVAALASSGPAEKPLSNLLSVAVTTAVWAAGVATAAVFTGWWPGRLLGALRSSIGVVFLGALCLLPICLPDYLHYWSWWQAWPIDSAIHRWAIEGNHMGLVRRTTLFLGLVCWCWPMAAWMVATSRIPAERLDLLALETRSRFRRQLLLARESSGALAIAWITIFAIIFNHTTSFDLAQERTLGYELRAMLSEGYDTAHVVMAAWPGALVLVIAGVTVCIAFIRREEANSDARAPRPSRAAVFPAILVIAICAIAPLALLWRRTIDPQAMDALRAGYARAAANSAIAAGIAGALAALAAVGLGTAFADSRRSVRRAASVIASFCFMTALLPAAAIAGALEAAYNTAFPSSVVANIGLRFDEEIYRTGAIVVLGYLARFGFIAALIGWWLARAEDRVMREMRELEGGGTLAGFFRASGPRWIAAALACFAIVFALAAGEVGLTALVQPPDFDAISAILLNNMHYQRDDLVVLMGRALTMIAMIAAVLAAGVVGSRRARQSRRPVMNAAAAILISATLVGYGCGEQETGDSTGDVSGIIAFGEPGRSIGQFIYPRAMDIDPAREVLYVIDRSGRVQRFGLDGQFQKQWLLPRYDNGYPTGITVAPDGRVFVADTHEHCISVFDAEGALLEQFGEFGTDPGQFIFPSDVAFGPHGRIYVSEFGDNDRIQVFEPDWTFIHQFGRFGSGPGEVNRPQSLSFNPVGTELFVADACNHRIQVFDAAGNLLRVLGSAGAEQGKFRYPYGVVHVDEETIAVTEFGNHRVQLLRPDGTVVAVLGSPGEGEGELVAPWTSAVVNEGLCVLDSRNSRVQFFPLPRVAGRDG